MLRIVTVPKVKNSVYWFLLVSFTFFLQKKLKMDSDNDDEDDDSEDEEDDDSDEWELFP